MIVEIGHFALKLALILCLLQLAATFTSHIKISKKWQNLIDLGKTFLPFAIFLLILAAFLALLQAFIISDFSLATVAQNSHQLLPLIFKLTAIWGNHEGSILLFTLLLSLFTVFLEKMALNTKYELQKNKKNNELLGIVHVKMQVKIALACQHAIIATFLAFILFTSNPFLRNPHPPAQGSDLNPLLQDIGLIIHPPLLYLGFVGFSIAFSFSIAALFLGRVDAYFGRLIRPWLLISWSFLTLGIVFGSYWAYYELGWGGYWFWDPVENASLMPWLSSTALIHSCVVTAKRGRLKLWTLLLSIITFSLALLGIFLVRADLLISVHNFTAIPERSLAILLIVIFFSGGALSLFATRAHLIEQKQIQSPLSREGLLIFNNIFLTTACASILTGTLYPLIMEVFWAERISVGPPFFNMIFAALMIPLLFVMPLGPLIGWKRANIVIAFERLGLGTAASLSVIITALFLNKENLTLSFLAIVSALGLACWLVVGSVCDFLHHSAIRHRKNRQTLFGQLQFLLSLPLSLYGRCLAHSGVGVSLAGIVLSSGFSHEVITAMPIGQSVIINDKILHFKQATPYLGPNYLEDQFTFNLWENQDQDMKFLGNVQASRRIFPIRNIETSEVGLIRHGLSHYYIAVGHFDEQGQLVVHVWYKAFILAIWLGGLCIAAGGILAWFDKKSNTRSAA